MKRLLSSIWRKKVGVEPLRIGVTVAGDCPDRKPWLHVASEVTTRHVAFVVAPLTAGNIRLCCNYVCTCIYNGIDFIQ